jgi:hypothetical protein
MGSDEKRREARHRVRLRAAIVKGKEETVFQTEDVSYKGLFLRSDTPPAVRSLIRVKVTLPSGVDVTIHAMVVHVIPPGDGARVPGAGLQFWGAFDPAQKKLWDEYVGELQRSGPTSTRKPVVAVPPGTPDPVQRKHPRHPAEIPVKLATVDELHTVYTRDISRGGMSLKTELDIAVGTSVSLRVIHPKTNEAFPLEGIVRRRILQPGFRGLGLELVGMDDAKRDAFIAFIRGEIAELGDDDVEVVA